MVRLVTYATDNMSKSMVLCAKSAKEHGVDEVQARTPSDISDEFKDLNKEIFQHERGAGYWLWKPYFIYKAMLEMNEGDILIYADAGVEFQHHVNNIIEQMDESIFFFSNGHNNVDWCKMDVMLLILPNLLYQGTHLQDCLQSYKQVQASVIFLKVNKQTKDFVKQWLLYCQIPGLIDDSQSRVDNYPAFSEHRHDQAILTCLQIKYNYKLHWWPTQYSEHIRMPGDNYPAMFNHHRKRNNEW